MFNASKISRGRKYSAIAVGVLTLAGISLLGFSNAPIANAANTSVAPKPTCDRVNATERNPLTQEQFKYWYTCSVFSGSPTKVYPPPAPGGTSQSPLQPYGVLDSSDRAIVVCYSNAPGYVSNGNHLVLVKGSRAYSSNTATTFNNNEGYGWISSESMLGSGPGILPTNVPECGAAERVNPPTLPENHPAATPAPAVANATPASVTNPVSGTTTPINPVNGECTLAPNKVHEAVTGTDGQKNTVWHPAYWCDMNTDGKQVNVFADPSSNGIGQDKEMGYLVPNQDNKAWLVCTMNVKVDNKDFTLVKTEGDTVKNTSDAQQQWNDTDLGWGYVGAYHFKQFVAADSSNPYAGIVGGLKPCNDSTTSSATA